MSDPKSEFEKAKETFVANGVDYHFKVSKLIENIKENPFPGAIERLPGLKECRSRLVDILIAGLHRDDLTPQLYQNENELPYKLIDNPERPGQFSEEALEAAIRLFNSGKELEPLLDEQRKTQLSQLLLSLKRIHGGLSIK